MKKLWVLIFAVAGVVGSLALDFGSVAAAPEITVFKSPTCGCCKLWADHLRTNGFEVKEVPMDDMNSVKAKFGISPALASCHTALVDDYLIEGHVPANDIKRLLTERPKVRGLAVPGMPMGSPGMEGPRSEPYSVFSFTEDQVQEFATH